MGRSGLFGGGSGFGGGVPVTKVTFRYRAMYGAPTSASQLRHEGNGERGTGNWEQDAGALRRG